ncbi:MAG: hypothetical protein RLZZ618_705 [Pseudomonadota bacterium]|jgi:outer membrane protein OmpA-like peptidoglycan-associated protein
MPDMKNCAALLLATLLALPFPSLLLAASVPVEFKGAKDSGVIGRYAGSVMDNAAVEAFASVRVPMGPARYASDKLVFDKAVTVEGQLGAYFYVGPKARGALEVFRNYQAALAQGGFTTLYSCALNDCRDGLITGNFSNEVIDPRRWDGARNSPASAVSRDVRFLSAKARRNGAPVHVMVFVAEPDSTWEAPTAVVIVVQSKPMDTGLVTVSSEQLQKGLAAEGRVALYGIYFDTARAELKPESKPQLDMMARLLTGDKALKVLIVGHTDNQGAAEASLTLSQRRAEAVVAALVATYKIDAARLKARGVASFAPVASNRSDTGRAKNRRVELVEQ